MSTVIPYTGRRLTADEVLVSLGCTGLHPNCTRALLEAAGYHGVEPIVIKRNGVRYAVGEGDNRDEDAEYMYSLEILKEETHP